MNRFAPALFVAALLALPSQSHAADTARSGRVAFTQHNNVLLMNPTDNNVLKLTTLGTGYVPGKSTNYPYYAWSPDGRYLLVVKTVFVPGKDNRSLLLLFDQRGHLLRSLGETQFPSDFNANWAIDGDQIAFTAWTKQAGPSNGFYHEVDRVNVNGQRSFLLSYTSQEGCGGGTGDPAAATFWQETGFGGVPTTLQWSMSRRVLLHSDGCGAGLDLVNLQTHVSRGLGASSRGINWEEAALSTTGRLVVVISSARANQSFTYMALADPRTGTIQRRLGPGELPAWSHDGRSLFYVRRTPGRMLHKKDAFGNDTGSQIYQSAIWRTDANGMHGVRLLLQNAYGFGPLNVSPDKTVLIFSRTDNAWKFYRYRDRLQGPISSAQAKRAMPQVQIERLQIGEGIRTLIHQAGRPAVQP